MNDPTKVDGPEALQFLKKVTATLLRQVPGLTPEEAQEITDTHASRILATAGSQLASLREEEGGTGWPGLVDTVISLPRMAETIPGLLGALRSRWRPGAEDHNTMRKVSEFAGEHMPDFVKRAEERQSKLYDMIKDELKIPEARTPIQHAEDAAGYMLSSPWAALPGATARVAPTAANLTKKLIGSAGEYILPTIKPTVANYMRGTLFGAGVGTAAQHYSDEAIEDANFRDAAEGVADNFVKYGTANPNLSFDKGGRVAKMNQMLKALSLNPHASHRFKANMLDDPLDNIKYAMSTAKAEGHLSDAEHGAMRTLVDSYVAGAKSDEELADTLAALHSKLFPMAREQAVGVADLRNAPWIEKYKQPIPLAPIQPSDVPTAVGVLNKFPWDKCMGGYIDAQ